MSPVNGTRAVNCAIHPPVDEPNADITGIGISLAWLITAALALTLVVANYFISYRPDVDPFGSEDNVPGSTARYIPRPNPIDKSMLGWRLKKHRLRSSDEIQWRRRRTREAFAQCMLTMSDFQLITGLSVLISGYSQLSSGISISHWDRIIDLAWFSSITHLCCLTFLRDYFCHHPRAQLWRIPGMIALVVLLGVALIPSSRFAGNVSLQTLRYNAGADYAICFFERNDEGKRGEYYRRLARSIDVKRQSTVVSAVILVFGMTNRIWRLYETSTNWYLSARRWSSLQTRRLLKWVYCMTKSRSFLIIGLSYRPMLASYLVCHVLLDIITSKAFEVWWLTIGLFWGLTNLMPISDPDDQQWTFGQVIALLMLVAPVIALVENYLTIVYGARPKQSTWSKPSEEEQPARNNTAFQTGPQQDHRQLMRGDPDLDFYTVPGTFLIAVWVIVAFIVAFSLFILISKGFSGDVNIAALELLWAFGGWTRYRGVPNILLLVYIMTCMLYSLTIDQHLPDSKAGRIAVNIACFFLYFSIITGGFLLAALRVFIPRGVEISVGVLFGMYLMLLVLEGFLSRGDSKSHAPHATQTDQEDILLGPIAASLLTPATGISSIRSAVGQLPAIDTSNLHALPRRSDTEADIGLLSPRRRYTSDI